MDPRKRPSFLEAWLDDLQDDLRRYGPKKLVPWLLLVCVAIGALVTLLVPADPFWNKPEISSVFFTATVTINGLLLALSWGSFAKSRSGNFLNRMKSDVIPLQALDSLGSA